MSQSRYQPQRPPIDFRNPTDLKEFFAGIISGLLVLGLIAWTLGLLA